MARDVQIRSWKAAALLCTAGLLYLVVGEVAPRAAASVRLFKEQAACEAKLRKAARWQEELGRLGQERERLRLSFSRQFVSLPRHGELSAVVHALHEEARARGVTLLEIRPDEEVAHDTYVELPLRLQMQGAFHPVAAFLAAIERSPHLMRVRELEMKSDHGRPDALRCSLLLDIALLRDSRKGT